MAVPPPWRAPLPLSPWGRSPWRLGPRVSAAGQRVCVCSAAVPRGLCPRHEPQGSVSAPVRASWSACLLCPCVAVTVVRVGSRGHCCVAEQSWSVVSSLLAKSPPSLCWRRLASALPGGAGGGQCPGGTFLLTHGCRWHWDWDSMMLHAHQPCGILLGAFPEASAWERTGRASGALGGSVPLQIFKKSRVSAVALPRGLRRPRPRLV